MKRLLTILILLCAMGSPAQSVTLAWDASPSADVGGYRVHFGLTSSNYTFVTNAGLVLTQAVVLPHAGRWFFAATAVSTNGSESAFSNEVQWEAKPVAPVVQGEPWFRLLPELWHSTNQVDWSSFQGEATWIAATNEVEFFTMRGLLIERVERVSER